MLIIYYVDGNEFASRTRDLVPRQNEAVKFNGFIYNIDDVTWVEDSPRHYVSIVISIA